MAFGLSLLFFYYPGRFDAFWFSPSTRMLTLFHFSFIKLIFKIVDTLSCNLAGFLLFRTGFSICSMTMMVIRFALVSYITLPMTPCGKQADNPQSTTYIYAVCVNWQCPPTLIVQLVKNLSIFALNFSFIL